VGMLLPNVRKHEEQVPLHMELSSLDYRIGARLFYMMSWHSN